MQSFDQSLAELVRARLVTYEEALRHSSSPDDFALVFRGVSSGGSSDDAWQNEQMAKQNAGARNPTAQPARPPTAAPAPAAQPQQQGSADGLDLEIERFGKE
jgi:hypothetical protein